MFATSKKHKILHLNIKNLQLSTINNYYVMNEWMNEFFK